MDTRTAAAPVAGRTTWHVYDASGSLIGRGDSFHAAALDALEEEYQEAGIERDDYDSITDEDLAGGLDGNDFRAEKISDVTHRIVAEHFAAAIPAYAIIVDVDETPWDRLTDSEWEKQSGLEDRDGARILRLDTSYVVLRDQEVADEIRKLAEEPTEEEKTDAVAAWMSLHKDSDDIPDEELVENFRLLYGRDPDATDREQGLWSLICAGVE